MEMEIGVGARDNRTTDEGREKGEEVGEEPGGHQDRSRGMGGSRGTTECVECGAGVGGGRSEPRGHKVVQSQRGHQVRARGPRERFEIGDHGVTRGIRCEYRG